jgi:hypothetical protein
MLRTATALVALLCLAAGGQAPPGAATALRQILQLSDAEVVSLTSGEVITRVEAADRREVMGAGAIRVQTTSERLIAGFRRVTGFTRSDLIVAAGLIGSSPAAKDFSALTLPPSEVKSLQECRVGDCDLKLSAAGIERFQREIRWGSGQAHAQTESLFRELMAAEAVKYIRGGDAMLEPLVDRREPVNRAAEFEAIFRSSRSLEVMLPDFSRRLAAPPATNGGGDADFLYWSSIDIGLKPVISITHVRVQKPGPPGIDVVIASKQIYANHYFDASLSVTALIRPASGGPGYLLYVNRSRVDLFRGILGGLTRTIVRRRVRDGLEKNMRLAQQHLEKT